MLKRRQFITATSAALTALSLPVRAQSANKLTLWGPPVTPSVLLAIAAQEGKAKDISPFDVQIWRSPDQLRAGLLNGDIAASIVPSYVAANLYNQGRKVKLFNIMSEGLNYIAAPVANGKPLVASLADLAQHSLVIPYLIWSLFYLLHDLRFTFHSSLFRSATLSTALRARLLRASSSWVGVIALPTF